MREFLHVDDMADACVFAMERDIEPGLYNVGTGSEVSIRQLAEIIMKVIGYSGHIVFDSSKPDGTPRKLLDVSKMAALGWQAQIPLRNGIAATYRTFVTDRRTERHPMPKQRPPVELRV
jgi:GDP-L-fucose synthase